MVAAWTESIQIGHPIRGMCAGAERLLSLESDFWRPGLPTVMLLCDCEMHFHVNAPRTRIFTFILVAQSVVPILIPSLSSSLHVRWSSRWCAWGVLQVLQT